MSHRLESLNNEIKWSLIGFHNVKRIGDRNALNMNLYNIIIIIIIITIITIYRVLCNLHLSLLSSSLIIKKLFLLNIIIIITATITFLGF